MIRHASSPSRSKAVHAVGFPWLSREEGSFEGEEAERVQSINSSKKISKWVSLLFSRRAVSHQSGGGREEKGAEQIIRECKWRSGALQRLQPLLNFSNCWSDICIISSKRRSLSLLYENVELKNENDVALKAHKLEGHLIEFHIWYSSQQMLRYSHKHDEYKGPQVKSDFYIMKEPCTGLTLTWLLLV